MSVICLMDCNNFFASCEQLLNPELRDKPVCVLSNNDGCVVARSKEAKILGVKMGMPAFMSKREFPQVVYVSGRLGVYNEISVRVMSVLSQFTPTKEVYSIDEAFFDLSGLEKLYGCSYLEIGRLIKSAVMEQVGIPVSIGISSSKVLAKLATERAKSGSGVYQIDEKNLKEELIKTKVHELWGVGKNTALLMRKNGLNTAYDFASQNSNWVKVTMGKRGLELKEELLGNSVLLISTITELPKSVQKTSSFPKSTNDYEYIKKSLNYHTHKACAKLRRLGLKAKVVGIMLRTKDFKIVFNKVNLVSPTNCEFVVYKQIDALLEKSYSSHIIYRSSGVVFENLIKESEEQLSLLCQGEDKAKKEKVSYVWDKLENRFGKNIIKSGF